MKYFAVLFLVLSGCASTPSDYNQGCQDGIVAYSYITNKGPLKHQDSLNEFCNVLESNSASNNGASSNMDRPRGRSNK